jgi:hypothetical protein
LVIGDWPLPKIKWKQEHRGNLPTATIVTHNLTMSLLKKPPGTQRNTREKIRGIRAIRDFFQSSQR